MNEYYQWKYSAVHILEDRPEIELSIKNVSTIFLLMISLDLGRFNNSKWREVISLWGEMSRCHYNFWKNSSSGDIVNTRMGTIAISRKPHLRFPVNVSYEKHIFSNQFHSIRFLLVANTVSLWCMRLTDDSSASWPMWSFSCSLQSELHYSVPPPRPTGFCQS